MTNPKVQKRNLSIFILSMVLVVLVLSMALFTKANAAEQPDRLVRLETVKVCFNDFSYSLSAAPTECVKF